MLPPLRRLAGLAVAALAVTLAVTQPAAAAPAAPAATGVNDPGGDAFYTPPNPTPAGRPGDLVRYRQINSTQWLIMYLTSDALGEPTVATGMLMLPLFGNRATMPVIGFAPGTQGPAFACTTSKEILAGTFTEAALVNLNLAGGFATVIADYEGYYPDPKTTYIVGRSEGPAVLDAVRAATRLAPAGLKATSPVVIQGYSQGGGAAMWAGEMQPTYAPEIPLKGIAAGGVPADLTATAANLDGKIGFGFLAYAAIGLDNAYPELKLDSYLNDFGRAKLAEAEKSYCTTDLFGLANQKISDYTTSNPLDQPAWKARLAQNKLGFSPPKVPVYQYLGGLDEIIPIPQGKALYRTYCKAGVKISFHTYEAAEHVGGAVAGALDVKQFTADRIAGKKAKSTC